MVRRLLTVGLRFAVQLFFRRIEVVGQDRVPPAGPTIFAINHPNGLVDPAMVLCFTTRPVSFLGKAPLFAMPLIGWFARALDSIPVYRRHDAGSDPAQNRETFAKARALLERGGILAIAPEGTSHSDPKLRPIKTGAARIALGAGTSTPTTIVPVGVFYTAKGTFRSSALIVFGDGLAVSPVSLDLNGEPASEVVNQVTERLQAALSAVVLEADDHETHALVVRAERLATGALPDPTDRSLGDVHAVRQRLLAGYRTLRAEEPVVLDRLVRRIDRLENAFREAHLDPALPTTNSVTVSDLFRAGWWLLIRIVIFLPLALPGLVGHFPGYLLIKFLVPRLVKEADLLATAKIIGGAIFYPLTWLGLSLLVGSRYGLVAGIVALVVAPLSGYAALKLAERFDRFVSATRALGLYLTRPERIARLTEERVAVRQELLALASRLEPNRPATR